MDVLDGRVVVERGGVFFIVFLVVLVLNKRDKESANSRAVYCPSMMCSEIQNIKSRLSVVLLVSGLFEVILNFLDYQSNTCSW